MSTKPSTRHFSFPAWQATVRHLPATLSASATDLRAEQLMIARANGDSTKIAVVAWMAYDSPETPGDVSVHGTVKTGGGGVSVSGYASAQLDVLGNEHAKAGGSKLECALMGYDAVRDVNGTGERLNVVAHSYGSTTAAYTLADLPNGVVDSFTTLGSAGIDPAIGGASGLNVPTSGVYAIQGFEVVALGGRLGSGRDDPAGSTWGATVLNSGLELRLGNSSLNNNVHDLSTKVLITHGYLDPGTTTLRNMALVGMGYGNEASRA
ncbi:MAG: alpha/beta hydrolase [Microbacteriaceae bacterium]